MKIWKCTFTLWLIFNSWPLQAQEIKIYKTDALLSRLKYEKKPLLVNFWATWCKPCIEELPSIDSLFASNPNIKVLFVSLDFIEDIHSKVKPLLEKKGIRAECVLLDEVNGNNFIDKISREWSGAIPATLLKTDKGDQLYQRKFTLSQLKTIIESK